MPVLRWSILLPVVLVSVLLAPATGCRLMGSRSPEGPPPAAARTAGEACPPLRVDTYTADLWVEALSSFIERRRIADACVLVRTPECIQDPPAKVLDALRKKVPNGASWSFRCQPGVAVLTLRDGTDDGERTISVGDGFEMSCRWRFRRQWHPWQTRLKLVGCAAPREP